MSDDLLKGVGGAGAQPPPQNLSVLQKKGESLGSLISEFLKTGDASSVKKSGEPGVTKDTSAQAASSEQLGKNQVPALSGPKGKGGIPGGPSGIGNPWLQPSRSMMLANLLIEVVLKNAGNKLEQGKWNAQQLQRQGDVALDTGKATREQYMEQARQQLYQAVQHLTKAAISLSTAVYSLSSEAKVRSESKKELEAMKSNPDAKIDDYDASKSRLDTSKKELDRLQNADPNVSAAAKVRDAEQKNVKAAKDKLEASQLEMDDLKSKHEVLKTEQTKADTDLKAAETKLDGAERNLDALRKQVPPALDSDIKLATDARNAATIERDRCEKALYESVGNRVDNETKQSSVQTRITSETNAVDIAQKKLDVAQQAYGSAIDASNNRVVIKAKIAEVKANQDAFDKEKVPGIVQYEEKIAALEDAKKAYEAKGGGTKLTVTTTDPTGKTTTTVTDPGLKDFEQKIDTYTKRKDDLIKEADKFEKNMEDNVTNKMRGIDNVSKNVSEAFKSFADGVTSILIMGSKIKEGDARMLEILLQNMMQQLQKILDASQSLSQSLGDTLSGLMQSLQSLYQMMKQLGTPYNVR